MSKPKAPKPPDPYATAGADFAYNNMSQYTPYGNLVVQAPKFGSNNQLQTPGSSTLELSPELQNIFNSQIQVSQGSLGEALRRQSQFGNLPELKTGIDPNIYAGTDTGSVEQSLFERQRGLLDPVFQQQSRQLQTQLSNQGIPVGSEAYGGDFGAMTGLQREYNRSLQDAALEAVLGAGQESRARRQQATGEYLTDANLGAQSRATLVNELAQVLGQQQVQTPGLQNFFAPQGADFLGAQSLATGAAQQNYAQQSSMFNNLMGGLFGLGQAAILGPRSP